MLIAQCFSYTNHFYSLFAFFSIGVLTIGFALIGYVVFNGMYEDSVYLEENEDEQDNERICEAGEYTSHEPELILSKMFANKN